MWFALLLCAILIGLLYTYLVWNFGYWKKLGVPEAKGYVLAGSFPQAFMQRRNMVYDVEDAYKQFRNTSPYLGFYMSRTPYLMILDPALAKTILTTNFKNFHDNEFGSSIDKGSDPLFSRNPFMLTGEEWKDKRAEITPAFTNTRLKVMYPIMQHVSKKLTSYLHMKLEKKPDGLDAKDVGANFTADVVANCIFGIDSLALSGQRSVLREMGSSIFDFSAKIIIYFITIQILPWVANFYKISFIPKRVEAFFENLTRDAVKLRTDGTVRRDDFLNYLLQMREKKGMSDLEMTAHTMTFFLDGFETSSYVIANLLNRLGDNPEVQRKLRAEIEATVQKGEDISFEQINGLEYLDQVFHESLRLDPIIAVTAKVCTETTELVDYKDKRLTFEKGMIVHIPVYSIQRDPEHYSNPLAFDPDRFSPENGGLKAYKDKGLFLSFGDGPRICLGMRFGTLQVKVAIVEILRNFIVKVNPKTKLHPEYDPKNFLLAPKGGIWIDFEPI